MRYFTFMLCAILSFTVHAQSVVNILGMRISPDSNKTTMTFMLSDKTTGGVKFLADENILVLTFDHARIKFKVSQAKLGGANVTQFSARELPDNKVEFRLQTKGKVTWKTGLELNPVTKQSELTLEVLSEGIKSSQRASTSTKALRNHVFTIAIDAGHGGKDTGALGKSGEREKAIVLAISKKVAARLRHTKGVRVVLTRTGDYFVPLRTRLNLARRHDADLFVAIHADAYFNHTANGASVYALSEHGATNEASRWLAQQANYSELGNIDFDSLPDKSRMLRKTLIDMAQTSTIRDSLRLGHKVLNALGDVSKLHYRRVEQAPFVVLKSPDIPSILIETGFISNPREAARLTNSAYQDKLADAISEGILHYINF